MNLRLRLRCQGAVQGVGFRPTVHRLATAAGLTGKVWNDPGGATIEVEGDETDVRDFADDLPTSLPPLARLDQLEVTEITPVGSTIFEVVASAKGWRPGNQTPGSISTWPMPQESTNGSPGCRAWLRAM